jgi:transmembrane sensor
MSMNDPAAKTRERLEQEAVVWYTRLTSGEIGAAERAHFEEWRKQSPAHDQAYRKIENLWQMIDVPVMADRH